MPRVANINASLAGTQAVKYKLRRQDIRPRYLCLPLMGDANEVSIGSIGPS